MEAIILAGGFGTRLGHMLNDVPKPMAPVNGRPFLRYIIDDLYEKGISKIVLAVGYKKETIIEYFGNNYKGIETVFSIEDLPLQTGGAIKKALCYCTSDDVFVINGDTFFNVNLIDMLNFKRQLKVPLVIATKLMHRFNRYGTVKVKDNRIIAFEEKQYKESGLINGGIYLIDRTILNDFEKDRFSFETDYLQNMVSVLSMYSYESEGYFIDIGIPEDYIKAQNNIEIFKTPKKK